ncbi:MULTISPECIES: M28 family metallopeptidase [Hyphobacterium]|uniref:M28 family metallopeptidase n=1 Tax=Hyphobacterium vulgare TaxID=1736751 RepID=A0ABV6ZTK6_9PROT
MTTRIFLAALMSGAALAACSEPVGEVDPATDETAGADMDAANDVAMNDDGSCAALYAGRGSENPPLPFSEEALANTDTSRPRACDTSPEITGADMAWRVQTLASDEFGGRAPSTPGGRAASQWIADEFARMGLEPAGDDGSYFQRVPLVEATLDTETAEFDISVNGGPLGLNVGDDAVFWTKRLNGRQEIDASDLVFVGYGIVAPEYGWNDYEGIDMTGRTAVILVNDPGYATGDPDLFNGNAMTYYGRWTYKYEEAMRQGAEGAIIIHQTAPASYGWNVVSSSWQGAQYDLETETANDRAALEGWITEETARRLFEATGLDFDVLTAAAHEPGFEAVPMEGATLDAAFDTEINRLESRNVAGVVPGTQRPDEYMLYMAHWDHLGGEAGADGSDGIYNGAVDNATGTGAIMEIAEMMANSPPERSALFVAVTLEESGLLGSAYFGENPLVPLNRIVGGVNMDGMMPVGPTSDVVVIGYGSSELEDILAEVAAGQDRTVAPDPNPAAGYFYRSDHISLAKRGVPMLYADGGTTHVEYGAAFGEEVDSAYRERAYHGTADEFSHDWDFDGLARDVQLMANVGLAIANSNDWPNWYEGNEFRALRDAMMNGDGSDAGDAGDE